MNAVLLVMSTSLGAGGDVVPAGWGERPLPMVVQAGGVGSGGNCCDPCGPACSKGGLIDRLKSKFGMKSSCGCAPTPACDPCATGSRYYQPNLLDKLRARMGDKKAKGCPCPDPCATAAVPAVVAPVNPPIEMPKGKDTVKPKDTTPDPKKGSDKTGGVSIPAVPSVSEPVTLPPLPSVPATAPRGGTGPN